jgi:hypothetical protein
MQPIDPQTIQVQNMYRVVPRGVQPDTPEFQAQQTVGRLIRRNGNTLTFTVNHQGQEQERDFNSTTHHIYPIAPPLGLAGLVQGFDFGNGGTPAPQGRGGPPGGSPGQGVGGGRRRNNKQKSRKQQQKRNRKTRQRRQRSNRTRRLH